jgi:EAL domain-containing protein (putative c-di-GMP-specific phosphodiesterase class I)
VETEEQMTLLQERGCDYVQGYYFGRPLPVAEVERFPHVMRLRQ